MKRSLTIIFSLLIAAIIGDIHGQEAVMNVRTRTTVSEGQTFQITFDVNAKAQDFRMPTLKGLTHVGGPSTGYSNSMTIINGKMTQSVSNTFTILVQADKEGTANVGAASCTVDGKTVSSKPFSIKVEKGNPNTGNKSQPGGQQPRQEPAKTIDANTLFAKASINKSTLYQGEEAIIVYKIYTQVPLTQFQIDKLPRNKGFWSEDLSENMTQVKQYSETVGGRQYQVAEIRRGALYAQESGTLTIAPLKTDVVAIIQTQTQRQRTGSIFDFFIDDPFFNIPQQQAVVKSLTSNSMNVMVNSLPEAPEGFGGGVGNFNISAKSDLKELHANEAFTYSVTVSGRGNLCLLETPIIDFPKGMEVYEPKVIDNINKGDNGLSGSRTFEWIITPQTQGEYEIPAFDYVYFDPVTGQYVKKQCNPIAIKVSKPLHTTTSKSDVEELNSDIHYIQKKENLKHKSEDGASPLFWTLLLFPVVVAITVILVVRHRQNINEDEASMRLQRATKLAKKRLRNAERHLNDGNDEQFYEEIYKALWGGIADKFNIQQSLLSSETIRRHLDDKKVDEALKESILQTLNDVDFARFAPGDSSTKKQTIFNEAMNTITKIGAIKVFTILAALLLSVNIYADNSNDMGKLMADANTAYDSGQYDVASANYRTIIEEGYGSWELYYNLGNAYYRQDSLGKAILSYERALRLAPNKKIVKDNLALARSKTSDNIEELPQMFLIEWTQAIVSLTTPRGWRAIIIVLVFLLSATACIFFIAKDYKLRKSMFVVGAILLLLTFFSSIDATISAKNLSNSKKAIVTEPMTIVKSSPDPKSVDKFVLHEGTKLTITDSQDEWWHIEIADGKSGWMRGGAERI